MPYTALLMLHSHVTFCLYSSVLCSFHSFKYITDITSITTSGYMGFSSAFSTLFNLPCISMSLSFLSRLKTSIIRKICAVLADAFGPLHVYFEVVLYMSSLKAPCHSPSFSLVPHACLDYPLFLNCLSMNLLLHSLLRRTFLNHSFVYIVVLIFTNQKDTQVRGHKVVN